MSTAATMIPGSDAMQITHGEQSPTITQHSGGLSRRSSSPHSSRPRKSSDHSSDSPHGPSGPSAQSITPTVILALPPLPSPSNAKSPSRRDLSKHLSRHKCKPNQPLRNTQGDGTSNDSCGSIRRLGASRSEISSLNRLLTKRQEDESSDNHGGSSRSPERSPNKGRKDALLIPQDLELLHRMIKDKVIFVNVDSTKAPSFPIVFVGTEFVKFSGFPKKEIMEGDLLKDAFQRLHQQQLQISTAPITTTTTSDQALSEDQSDRAQESMPWPPSLTTNLLKKDNTNWILQLHLIPLHNTNNAVVLHAVVVQQAFECSNDGQLFEIASFFQSATRNSVATDAV